MRLGDQGFVALWLRFSDANVLREFGRKHSVEFRCKGRRLGLLTLRGSSRALDALVRCQAAMREAGIKSRREGPIASHRDEEDGPFAY